MSQYRARGAKDMEQLSEARNKVEEILACSHRPGGSAPKSGVGRKST